MSRFISPSVKPFATREQGGMADEAVFMRRLQQLLDDDSPPSAMADVTSLRARYPYVYQNTNVKPLYVSINVGFSTTAAIASVYAGDTNPPTTLVANATAPTVSGAGASVSLFFIVLPGHYYTLSTAGTVTITSWVEWN